MNWLPKIVYIEHQTAIAKTIQFTSPPEGDPLSEKFSHKTTKTTSSNGQTQVQYNYGEQTYSLKFLFQTEITKGLLVEFFNKHAVRGAKFDYYISSDEIDFQVFEIDQKKLDISRPIPSCIEGEFEYDFKIALRRVL